MLSKRSVIDSGDIKESDVGYQVSIQRKTDNAHYCGGAILNKNYILTVADCFHRKSPSDFRVFAGSIDLNGTGIVHEIQKFIIHENYLVSDSARNDIALIKVATPFVEGEGIRFVTLPEVTDVVNAGMQGVVVGWGLRESEEDAGTILLRSNVRIADKKDCKNKYASASQIIFNTQICAHYLSPEDKIDTGDGGSPLIVNGKVVGLVSFGLLHSTIYPVVYTLVSPYLDWIKEKAV